jgi:hypothetical protein
MRDVALREGVLYVESDISIYVSPVQDTGEGVLSRDLIPHSIGGHTLRAAVSRARQG